MKIIKKELEINDKTTGYITGLALYNQLGLTTQIPNVVEIATNKRKLPKVVYGTKVKYIQIKASINNENIKLLQILDAIKNIKNIPDSELNTSYKILKSKVLDLGIEDQNSLVQLSFSYSPMTRALLGSILECSQRIDLMALKNSLNPLTRFDVKIDEIENKKRWNIK